MGSPKYSLRFTYQIQGCSINALIDDDNILNMISDNNNVVKKIIFESNKKGTTMLTGHLISDNLKDAYVFILYRLRPIILKSIVLTEVECLSFPDKPELNIENEEEIRQAKLPTNQDNCYLFAKIIPNIPDVGKEEIQQNLHAVASNTCDVLEDSFYWAYLTNTVCDVEKGVLNHDSVKQFRLMWSAFNKLYNLKIKKGRERERIERFAESAIVFKFFDEQRKVQFYDYIKRLVDAQLYLRVSKDNINVSEQLKIALRNYDKQEISKSILLCLYAVRNSLFHGEASKEIELSRVCIKILGPLVKHIIKQWNLDPDVCAELSNDESSI